MIKLNLKNELAENMIEGQLHGLNYNQDPTSYRVNWITQRTQRDLPVKTVRSTNSQNVESENHTNKYSKVCPQKEITLLNFASNNGEEFRNHRHFHHDPSQHSGNSQKNSCEKRQKLSLMSKRPSLRKISDFISFKENVRNSHEEDKIWENVDPICLVEDEKKK
jgi:hypothetical protein